MRITLTGKQYPSRLGDCLNGHLVTALVGMSKNAGKTTVLNHLLGHFRQGGMTVAITGIGRDGEDTDIVTGTKKPKIYVPPGSIVATAEALLGLSDITPEIIEATGFRTPMGRVIIARALSAGFVQLGGPSVSCQLSELLKTLKAHKAGKVLIDGAVSRKSASSPHLAQAVVLCTGASLASSMDEVVRSTRFAAGMLMLPPPRGPAATGQASPAPPDDDCVQVRVCGALTNAKINNLLASGRVLRGTEIICDDPSKILISQSTCEKLAARGASLAVESPANLAAIAVNPVSARGFSFKKDVFLQKMAEAVPVPVFDVCQ